MQIERGSEPAAGWQNLLVRRQPHQVHRRAPIRAEPAEAGVQERVFAVLRGRSEGINGRRERVGQLIRDALIISGSRDQDALLCNRDCIRNGCKDPSVLLQGCEVCLTEAKATAFERGNAECLQGHRVSSNP